MIRCSITSLRCRKMLACCCLRLWPLLYPGVVFAAFLPTLFLYWPLFWKVANIHRILDLSWLIWTIHFPGWKWDFFLLFSPFIWSRVRPNRFAPLFDFCPHAPTVVSQPAGPIDVLPWQSVKSTAAQLQIVYLQTRMPIIKYIRLQMSVLLFCKVTFSRGHTSWGPKRIILARRMLLDDNGKLSALKTFHISAVPPSRSIDAVRINCKVARVHLRLVCRVPAKLFGILCRACADSRLSFNPAPRCSF